MGERLTRRIRLVLPAILCGSLASGCGGSGGPTLLFVGDIMPGRAVESVARARGDWLFPFRRLAPRIQAADLAFANLECVVATGGGPVQFRADPAALGGLRDAGFDIISLANNHTADAGLNALAEMA